MKAKSSKKTIKKFFEPTLGASAYLFIDYTSEEVNKFFAKKDIETDEELNTSSGATFTVEMKTDTGAYNAYYVWIEDRSSIPVLTHECLHLVKNIFVKRHIPFDAANHELIAYHLEYWVETFIEAILKHERNTKKSKPIQSRKKTIRKS